MKLRVRHYWAGIALCGFMGCGDGDESPGDRNVPLFEEPTVEMAEVLGLGILHSRPEQEPFYEDGVFAIHHPIAFVVQMAWSEEGYEHPLYVGLVNEDRTRACLVGSRSIRYGGPETTSEDTDARTFVIQTHIPDHCDEEALGQGPYDVWVGSNRFVAANPEVSEDDTEAPDGYPFAFLREGNVFIYGETAVEGPDGSAVNSSCQKLESGVGGFARTGENCGAKITVAESPGSNLLVDKFLLDSSVGVLTVADVEGQPRCVQDKGRPLLEGRVDLALYGEQPESFESDEVTNDLDGEIKIVQRLCPDDRNEPGDTRCDRGEAPWIELLVNPTAPSERPAWDDAAVQERFPDAPLGPPPVDATELELGGYDDAVTDMSYLDLRQVPQQLVLPRGACMPVLGALADERAGFVLETCIAPDSGAEGQDVAYGGADDNCIRQIVEIAKHEVHREFDPAGGPPSPGTPPPGMPGSSSDSHSGGWLSALNSRAAFSKEYGDSDWASLEFDAGYAVAGGTDGAYAGAYFYAGLDGEFDFTLASLELYADAHDSSNSDGSEAVFEATSFGVSEGVESSASSSFEMRVSAWGGGFEKCVDENFGWWVISIKIEGCASFSADVGGTLTGEFFLTNGNGNLEAAVGIVDVGPLIDANMDGSIQVGDGCCSVKISGELEPLAYLSIGNDFYLIGEVEQDGDLVGLTFVADLVDMLLELVDGKIKLKVKFLGTTKSTKLINKDGWEWSSTLLGFSVSL